jgi:hypothetical protein
MIHRSQERASRIVRARGSGVERCLWFIWPLVFGEAPRKFLLATTRQPVNEFPNHTHWQPAHSGGPHSHRRIKLCRGRDSAIHHEKTRANFMKTGKRLRREHNLQSTTEQHVMSNRIALERLVCNQEVGGSIPLVSTLSLYSIGVYSIDATERTRSAWLRCRVAPCFDVTLYY